MIYTRAHHHHYNEHAAQAALPERLGAEGVRLMIADGIALLALVGLSVPFNATRGAWLAALTIFVCATLLGRYRQSIAPAARDEWYTTMTVTFVAGVASLVLVPLFVVPWWICAGVLMGWSIAGGAAAVALTMHRRADKPVVATANFLTAANRRRPRNPVLRAAIAVLDFVFAACATILLSPVLIVCALAIALGHDGPVLFLQDRVGVDGREFRMFKFRTMRPDSGNEWATNEGDDRVTHVGRFLRRTSLDELPQLWNVLRGEMSLVGPRPEMSEYADQFVRTVPFYEDRQAVPPGITGWAQVEYDRNFAPAEFENVLPYDLFYVAHYSISLYLFCLIKTVFEVLRHRAV
ncbi:MAG: sugar transferase [Candidatus Eremiobacteraeota bacterium]|nr:sugar transferase [Candidatus Eremiobacteraeota bacterium]